MYMYTYMYNRMGSLYGIEGGSAIWHGLANHHLVDDLRLVVPREVPHTPGDYRMGYTAYKTIRWAVQHKRLSDGLYGIEDYRIGPVYGIEGGSAIRHGLSEHHLVDDLRLVVPRKVPYAPRGLGLGFWYL